MIGIDLGSNTLRVVELDCVTKRRIRAYEKIVRTAKDMHLTGEISKSSIENIYNAIKEASLLFDFNTKPAFCVTTQAMRIAKNAPEILEEIRSSYGLNFRIISGEEEAYLTSLAVENALNREGFDNRTYALLDLGGGSTEIMLCKNGDKKSQSFPFGIVTTAEKYVSCPKEGVLEVVSMLDSFLKENVDILHTYKRLVTTAGTPTTVAAFLEGMDYASYDSLKVNGKCLKVADFEMAYEKLMQMPHEEAERFTGTNRRDLVMVGIMLIVEMMKKLGFYECVVFDDGLREGVAISNCNNL